MNELMARTVILILLLFCGAVSLYAAWREDRGGLLTVAFLNVGQGDAIFIDAPSGNQVLIDGGPGKAVLRELSAVMPFYDRSINVILMSHPDQDHVGGLSDVLKRYEAGLVIEPGLEGDSSLYAEFKSRVAEGESRGTMKKILARRGMVVDLGEGVNLEILFPDRDPTGMESNSASIIARLVYGENEFLLTGDSPASIEEYLVSLDGALQGKLESDVLKAGHHGSKTSTSENFVSTVKPKYAVISSGFENRYGHPHLEVIKILERASVTVLRTDQRGRIIFKSDGVNLKLK